MAYEEGAQMWAKLYLAAPVWFRASSQCCSQLGSGPASPTLMTSEPVLLPTRGHEGLENEAGMSPSPTPLYPRWGLGPDFPCTFTGPGSMRGRVSPPTLGTPGPAFLSKVGGQGVRGKGGGAVSTHSFHHVTGNGTSSSILMFSGPVQPYPCQQGKLCFAAQESCRAWSLECNSQLGARPTLCSPILTAFFFLFPQQKQNKEGKSKHRKPNKTKNT